MSQAQDGPFDLDRLRRRDRDAFRWLVKQHQPIVAGLSQSMGLSGADLDDAAAEVFAAVYTALPRFEGRCQLSTWVYRIALRTIGKLRQRKRKHTMQELPDERPDPDQATPDRRTETAEVQQRIWAAVAKLDEREAAAIEMHYRQGLGLEQIAEVLECPIGTVKTLMFRGRQRLRRMLEEQEIGP